MTLHTYQRTQTAGAKQFSFSQKILSVCHELYIQRMHNDLWGIPMNVGKYGTIASNSTPHTLRHCTGSLLYRIMGSLFWWLKRTREDHGEKEELNQSSSLPPFKEQEIQTAHIDTGSKNKGDRAWAGMWGGTLCYTNEALPSSLWRLTLSGLM